MPARTECPFVPGAPLPAPGDMIGFSGADPVADMINLGTLGWPRRDLSHVGLVARHQDHGLCIYESTTTVDLPCLERGKPVSGMQVHPLTDRVRGYPGRVFHFPLRRPLSADDADGIECFLRNLCQKKLPYDYLGAVRSRSMLIGVLQRTVFGREDLKQIFCSELSAATWAYLQILKTRNASRWNPNSLGRYAERHGLTRRRIEWLTEWTDS